MYDIIKKISHGHNSFRSASNEQQTRTISKQSFRTLKTRKIVKQRFAGIINKLKDEIITKIDKIQSKFDEIILEDSPSSESQAEIRLDDWNKQITALKLQQNKKLGRTSLMASKKHSMVRKRPNQLIVEKLPQ